MTDGERGRPTEQNQYDLTAEIDPVLNGKKMSEEDFLKRNPHIDLSILKKTDTGKGCRVFLSDVLAYISRFDKDNLYFAGAVQSGVLDVKGRFTQEGFDKLVLNINEQRRDYNARDEARIADRKRAMEPFDLGKIRLEVERLLNKYIDNARFGLTVEYEGRGESKHHVLVLTFSQNLKSDKFSTRVVRGSSKKELLMRLAEELDD